MTPSKIDTPAQPDPAPPAALSLFWYAITGRIPGDDEDSALIFHAPSKEDAMEMFRSEMHRDEDLEAIMEEYGGTLIINHVLQSSAEISIR